MLQILIVDDEAIHLMHVIGEIHSLKPSCIVFSARDGVQALDILRAFHVDMLITDICMPNMDGLDLVAEAKALHPDLFAVVLTGYGDFEYARRSIEIGVDRYLLKVQDQEEMFRLIDQVEERLIHRRKNRWDEQENQQALEQIRREQDEYKLEMYLLELEDASAGEAARRLLGEYGSGLTLCAKEKNDAHGGITMQIWKEKIDGFLDSCGMVRHKTIRCRYLRGLAITLVGCDTSPDDTFYRSLERFMAGFDAPGYFLGISQFTEALNRQARLAFQQAKNACEGLFYLPRQSSLRYDPARAIQPFVPAYVRPKMSDVYDCLMLGESAQASELFIRHAREYAETKHPFPGKFKEVIMFCFWRMIGDAKAVLGEEAHGIYANMERLISSSPDLDALEKAIRILCQQFCDLMQHCRESSTDQALDRAVEILRKEYSRDWSLEELAQQVHFNPSYFSSLFKKRFGVGYSDTLREIRLNQAARLLESGTQQVQQVAASVGYTNVNNFIRAFVKKYGMTPNEYRRRQRRDE